MPASYFLDSNVVIYSLDASDAPKQTTALALVRRAVATGEGCISSQVVAEVLNVLTRLGAAQLGPGDALKYLRDVLEPLHQVRPTPELFEDALRVRDRYGISFYDSMIIAAARLADCSVLYSEDLQHEQVFNGLRVINPFA